MQRQIIEKLSNELMKSRSRNPAYSLRAFSKRIGIQPSALSEFLNGKRQITKKMGEKILLGLGINSVEVSSIINSTLICEEEKLSIDFFKTISEWQYFAILSLAEISDFEASPEWISSRLNITIKDAKVAIDRLIRLEMLLKDSNGDYIASGIQYKTPTDILNSSLKNHTIQTMDLAKESLMNDPIEVRDFSTTTMAIDPSKIDEAKSMIQAFRRKISKKLESGNKKEVYKIAIQLFPLSREIKRNNNV